LASHNLYLTIQLLRSLSLFSANKMGIDVTVLWKAPEVNPINKKARSIPAFNPINMYGRVFTFSWLGFMVAFMSWYAFPPLMPTSKHLLERILIDCP
jgi:hypothetical protein